AQDITGADLSKEDAAEIAVAEYPDATVLHIEADDEDGAPVYEVTLSNGVELEIHGNSGDILEHDDDGPFDGGRDFEYGRDDAWDVTGELDDGTYLLEEAAISPEEAVAIAQGEVEGRVGEVELERYRDGLVYVVEIGGVNEVIVDAMTGEVLAVQFDD